MAQLDSNIIVTDRLEKKLIKSLQEIQDEIFAMVDRLTRKFKSENGYYVPDDETTELLNTLNKQIKVILKRAAVNDEVAEFIDNFDLLDKNIKAIQSDLNGIKVDKSIFTEQRQWAIDATLYSLLNANIDIHLANPIKQILYSRVAYGASVVQAERQLKQLIAGGGQRVGALERWVGQIARDTINQYQGTINQQIKVQYELTNIRYVGPLVTDSRPQCVRWIEKFDGLLTDDQLDSEIRWAYNNGKGMIPDTVPENFCQNRGGYNCIHEAIPVRNRK